MVFIYLIVIGWISLSIWAVMDIAKYPYNKRMRKLVWTNIVVLFPFIGLLIYLMIGRKSLLSA
ncbi:PLDc N-terminal domain-containing protein [Pedobacter sp. Hv1]|uniref:PLDc N-terminal domain-containing protein n=1 Tax=Pedobacter sp. Hv1 TaxID=1740090 RepID=UPI0006D897FE|nr:PLDc N-terminal domain-containing protein [Pedobacter sp. Hv1]KQC00985.1 hypothetical protein AQF98_09955 [Pedobacter sp. Hv1]